MPSACPNRSSKFPKQSAMCSCLCQSAPRPSVRRAAKWRTAMNKLLLALGVLIAGALLLPDVAEAQRGGRGGGGARVGGGGARVGGGGVPGRRQDVCASGRRCRGAAIAARPGRVAGAGGRFDNRYGNRGDWRYGYGATGGRSPTMADAILTMAWVPAWPRGLSSGQPPRTRIITIRTPPIRRRSRHPSADTA